MPKGATTITMVTKKTLCASTVLFVCCLQAGYACLPKRPGNLCPCEADEDCELFRANTKAYGLFKGTAKCDTEAKKCRNVYNINGCGVTSFLSKHKSLYRAVEALRSKLNAQEESDPIFGNRVHQRACLTDNDNFCTNYTRITIYRNTTLKILVQNWLSAQMSAQLAQLMLSEVLKVPTILVHVIEEDGKEDVVVQSKGAYEDHIGKALYRDAPKAYNLNTVEKCNNRTNSKAGVCADMMMEVWRTIDSQIGSAQYPNTRKTSYGAQGQIGLYVPRWILDENPDLASYRGFKSGDAQRILRNRNLFRLPVSWSDYCVKYAGQQGTGDNVTRVCPIPDKYQGEYNHSYYFGEPAGKVFYGGYFEPGNNGSAGYLTTIDYCDWGEYSKFMFGTNGLSINYGGPGPNRKGYRTQDLIDILRAAKDNKAGFLVFWWQPELLPVELQYSDKRYEMLRIQFPPNNKMCRNDRNQAYSDNLCKAEKNVNSSRYKNAGCDWAADPLRKVVSERMVNNSKDLDVRIYHRSQADLKNPIYRFLQGFKVENGLLDQMFAEFLDLKKDILPSKEFEQVEQMLINHAVCNIARANNLPSDGEIYVEDMWKQALVDIPSRYVLPEVKLFRERDDVLSICFTIFQVLAGMSFVFCIAMAVLVWKYKKQNSIKRTQPAYTMVILSGCALIFIHVFLSLMEPNPNDAVAGSAHCIASRFCRHIGIFATIVPLFVILSTITTILSKSGKRFSKKRGQRAAKAMLCKTVISLCLVTLYCIAWTLVDGTQSPPKFKPIQMYSTVLNGVTEQFLVRTECPVNEEDNPFSITLNIIEGLFVLWGVALAIRNGGVRKEYNTSKPMAFAMYNAGITLVIPLLVWFEVIKFDDGSTRVLLDAIATWWIFGILIVFYYFPKIVFLIADIMKSIKRQCRHAVESTSFFDSKGDSSIEGVESVSTLTPSSQAGPNANQVGDPTVNPMVAKKKKTVSFDA